MRRKFFEVLHEQMKKNKDIYFLTGDLGYGGVDKIQKDFPDRFINCGASEFAMCGIAVGLALEGKIPFTYTITPFYYRAFEMLRTYIDHEKIPVKMVGSGRNDDYKHDGYSHNASDIHLVLSALPNVLQWYPESADVIEDMIKLMINNNKPVFLSLSR